MFLLALSYTDKNKVWINTGGKPSNKFRTQIHNNMCACYGGEGFCSGCQEENVTLHFGHDKDVSVNHLNPNSL